MPYRFFESSFVHPVGQAFIVVAFGNLNQDPTVELFILTPDDDCWLVCRRFGHDRRALRMLDVEEDVETFLVNDSLDMARNLINERVWERRRDLEPTPIVIPAVTLAPARTSQIVALRMRSECGEQLQQIERLTDHTDLVQLLQTSKTLTVTSTDDLLSGPPNHP